MNHLYGLPHCSFSTKAEGLQRPAPCRCCRSLGLSIQSPDRSCPDQDSWACLRCKHLARWANAGVELSVFRGSYAESIGLIGICWVTCKLCRCHTGLSQWLYAWQCRPVDCTLKPFALEFTGQKEHQQMQPDLLCRCGFNSSRGNSLSVVAQETETRRLSRRNTTTQKHRM